MTMMTIMKCDFNNNLLFWLFKQCWVGGAVEFMWGVLVDGMYRDVVFILLEGNAINTGATIIQEKREKLDCRLCRLFQLHFAKGVPQNVTSWFYLEHSEYCLDLSHYVCTCTMPSVLVNNGMDKLDITYLCVGEEGGGEIESLCSVSIVQNVRVRPFSPNISIFTFFLVCVGVVISKSISILMMYVEKVINCV